MKNTLSQSYSMEWNKSGAQLTVVTEKNPHENISVPLEEVSDETAIKDMRWHEMSESCELGTAESMTSDTKSWRKRKRSPEIQYF